MRPSAGFAGAVPMTSTAAVALSGYSRSTMRGFGAAACRDS